MWRPVKWPHMNCSFPLSFAAPGRGGRESASETNLNENPLIVLVVVGFLLLLEQERDVQQDSRLARLRLLAESHTRQLVDLDDRVAMLLRQCVPSQTKPVVVVAQRNKTEVPRRQE